VSEAAAAIGIGAAVGAEALFWGLNQLDSPSGKIYPWEESQYPAMAIIPIFAAAGYALGLLLLSGDDAWYLMAGMAALGLLIVFYVYGVP
jgi:hypothetical protein